MNREELKLLPKHLWHYLRQVTGDDAYERYVAHQQAVALFNRHGRQKLIRAGDIKLRRRGLDLRRLKRAIEIETAEPRIST